MKALVIGGTGPTGPYIVEGLLRRGYEVTIYHRGTHEVEAIKGLSARIQVGEAVLLLGDRELLGHLVSCSFPPGPFRAPGADQYECQGSFRPS